MSGFGHCETKGLVQGICRHPAQTLDRQGNVSLLAGAIQPPDPGCIRPRDVRDPENSGEPIEDIKYAVFLACADIKDMRPWLELGRDHPREGTRRVVDVNVVP